jgi:8-amino-7-oxononanoate synthase
MFCAPATLLFDLGFNTNAIFFACIPQPGSALRAALRAPRAESAAFKEGKSSLFVATESMYSMDGTVLPLHATTDAMGEIFPTHTAHLLVSEAHAMRIYT